MDLMMLRNLPILVETRLIKIRCNTGMTHNLLILLLGQAVKADPVANVQSSFLLKPVPKYASEAPCAAFTCVILRRSTLTSVDHA